MADADRNIASHYNQHTMAYRDQCATDRDVQATQPATADCDEHTDTHACRAAQHGNVDTDHRTILYTDGHANANRYRHSDVYTNTNGHGYRDIYTNAQLNADGHAYAYSDVNSNTDAHHHTAALPRQLSTQRAECWSAQRHLRRYRLQQ